MVRSALVVGAGPVGVATALALADLGVAVRICDREQAIPSESRATGILPATLDLLEPLGLAQPLIAAGVRLKGVDVISGGRTFAAIDPSRLPHRYNFMLAIPQDRTVRLLTEALARRGIEVERGVQVNDVETSTNHASATFADGREVVTDWLIGADGAHSTVRTALGIGFPGAAYPFEWSLADAEIQGDVAPDRGEMILEPQTPLIIRLPVGDGRHRLMANASDVIALAPARWGLGHISWRSNYRVSHRCAASFGHGRIRIIGDAAHIHSPAGGRGMNLGIADGILLARQIASGSLEGWDIERRDKATAVIRESDAMQRIATSNGNLARWIAPRLLGALTSIPTLHDRIVRRLAGVDLT